MSIYIFAKYLCNYLHNNIVSQSLSQKNPLQDDPFISRFILWQWPNWLSIKFCAISIHFLY